MNIFEIIQVIWRRRIAVLIVFALCNICAVMLLLYGKRVYEAEALILVDQSRSRPQGSAPESDVAVVRERYLQSQARIAKSETVVADALRATIAKRGPEKPGNGIQGSDGEQSGFSSLFGLLGSNSANNFDDEVQAAQNAFWVRIEPNTDLLRISVRDGKPDRAAEFANQIAQSLVERTSKLSSNPLAVEFFREQVQSRNKQLEFAMTDLENYSVTNRIFSVLEQRRLLLERRDQTASELAITQTSIKRAESELDSLKLQLSSLRSKITLPATIFGDSSFGPAAKVAASGSLGDDPPLLHVKLYQESAQKIVNSNSTLAGLKASEVYQIGELRKSDKALEIIAQKEGEFNKLERKVVQLKNDIELYSRKNAEAEIDTAWRSNDRLSSMQVVQAAFVRSNPVFPRKSVVLPIAILAGLLAGCLVAIGSELISNLLLAGRNSLLPRVYNETAP